MSIELSWDDSQAPAVTLTDNKGREIGPEDTRLTQYTSESQGNASREIIIAVMGMTGTGKSTFVSTVTGKPVKIGHDLQACTQDIEVVTTHVGPHTVHFIDTPGFDDTDRTDVDILKTIAEFLKLSKGRDVRLSGILYLHRITDQRVGRTAMKNLRMFGKLVGESNFGNVVLVTTMWDKVDRKEGVRRHEELIGSGKFWGGMIAAGAKAVGHDGTMDCALTIAKTVLDNSPVVLQIQAELRRYGTLGQTSAGKEVSDGLMILQARHEKELAEMRENFKAASAAKNMELVLEIQLYYDQLIKELKEVNEAQVRLNQQTIQEMSSKIKELEQRWTCIVC